MQTIQSALLVILTLCLAACTEEITDPHVFRLNYPDDHFEQDPELSRQLKKEYEDALEKLRQSEEDELARLKGSAREEFLEYVLATRESIKAEQETNAILIGDVEAAVERFQFKFQRLPTNLQEMVDHDCLYGVPYVPEGFRLRINGKSLEVTLEEISTNKN